jgi:hypothetical protein
MSSTGTPLNLNLFANGSTGWGTNMDANFSIINAAIAALQAGGTTGPAGAQGPAGPVGMIFAGQWTSTTTYAVPDVVTYNGSTYLAIAANSNTAPDTNPNTWQLLAAAGAAGPAGPTGPQGPQGVSGSASIAFPITVTEGGTGATTASAARAALGAAASGVNSDITSLQSVAASGDAGSQVGINILGSDSGTVLAIQVSNGTVYSSWQANGVISCAQLEMSGGLLCGSGQFSGLVELNAIGPASPGVPITVDAVLVANGLVVQGAAPVGASGELTLGGSVASTATAGGGQATPGTVLGYIMGYEGTTPIKIPYYAA